MLEKNPWVILQTAKYHYENQPVQIQVAAQWENQEKLFESIEQQPYVEGTMPVPSITNKIVVMIKKEYSDWPNPAFDTVVSRAHKQLLKVVRYLHEYDCGYWGEERMLEIILGDSHQRIEYRPPVTPGRASVHTELGILQWQIDAALLQERYEEAGRLSDQKIMLEQRIEQLTNK